MECFHVARVLYGCWDESVHAHTSACSAGEVGRIYDGWLVNLVFGLIPGRHLLIKKIT